MKAVRLLQILLALAAIAYLVLLHDMNEMNVVLPFFVSLPPALVILVALAIGFLLGWLPPTLKSMGRRRELRRLRRRVTELEGGGAPAYAATVETPVIPDRTASSERTAAVYTEEEVYTEHENL